MKKLILVCAALMSLSACTTTQQGAATGAAAGAIIGGVTTNSVAGAAIGAAAGGIAGAVIGRVAGSSTECYYKDAYGNLYRAACPKG